MKGRVYLKQGFENISDERFLEEMVNLMELCIDIIKCKLNTM